MKLTGAEITIKLLEQQGIDIIAGIPGGSNLPLYHALAKSRIRHVLARHEQGAGFIAQGIARSTGKAAVCFATSGPGAANLITAIADAKLDSIPIIAITGQVPSSLIGTDAFQEIDIYGMTIPITKHNFLVRSASEILTVIPEAFRIALSGRPGPVLIDIPKDVQCETLEIEKLPDIQPIERKAVFSPEQIKKMHEMIESALRPAIYFGAGIIASGASEALLRLARRNSLPAASTLMGLGGFPPDDPLYLGMLGMHGAPCANYVLQEADLIIALGVRFDDRATGSLAKFCPHAKVLHVDIDRSEIGKLRGPDFALESDIAPVLDALSHMPSAADRSPWLRFVCSMKEHHPLKGPDPRRSDHPLNIIRRVSRYAPKDAIVTTDVGQHQMWTAQGYPFRVPRTFLTSGGLGTMGFGLPCAIGAALAHPERTVICFSGDGSILMNIQEMATLCEMDLNVKVIIMNNGYLGLVRQQQELFYSKTYMASKFSSRPDFAGIARAFGLESLDLAEEKGSKDLKDAIAGKGPCVINAPIPAEENVFPMVPPGGANTDMIGGELCGEECLCRDRAAS